MKVGTSFIFRSIASFLFFLINVFALYLLLRGHNMPGGGFIGGLVSALSLIMLSLSYGVERTQQILRTDPIRLAAVGLILAFLTALLPVVAGDDFLKHYNGKFTDVPVLGSLSIGTPLLFDIGIFLVVVGVTAKMIFILARSISGLTALEPREWRRYAAELEEPVEREHSRDSVLREEKEADR